MQRTVPGGPFKRRVKVLGGRLLLAALPLLLAFLACESILRMTGPTPADPDSVVSDQVFLTCDHDSLLGWIFPPDAAGDYEDDNSPVVVETNAWGLRGPAYAPDPGGITIVVLGDSYAFGWGVEEAASFPRRLERILRARYGGLSLTVINAGIPGYGPYQQIEMLRRVRRHVRPDIVISTFSLANDPVDELRIARYAPDRLRDYVPAVKDPDAIFARLSRGSRVVALVDERTRSLQMFLANNGADARKLAEASVSRLVGECEEMGAPLLLVVVPQRNQILRGGPSGWLAARFTRALRALPREIARRHGIPLVDLTRVLSAVQRDGDAFLPHDAHWSPAGHEAVAQAIAGALPAAWMTRDVVPPASSTTVQPR